MQNVRAIGGLLLSPSLESRYVYITLNPNIQHQRMVLHRMLASNVNTCNYYRSWYPTLVSNISMLLHWILVSNINTVLWNPIPLRKIILDPGIHCKGMQLLITLTSKTMICSLKKPNQICFIAMQTFDDILISNGTQRPDQISHPSFSVPL